MYIIKFTDLQRKRIKNAERATSDSKVSQSYIAFNKELLLILDNEGQEVTLLNNNKARLKSGEIVNINKSWIKEGRDKK